MENYDARCEHCSSAHSTADFDAACKWVDKHVSAHAGHTVTVSAYGRVQWQTMPRAA